MGPAWGRVGGPYRRKNISGTLSLGTLTNLYNARPMWLQNAHERLDRAVFAAYGWPADIADEEILQNLLALNQERAARVAV